MEHKYLYLIRHGKVIIDDEQKSYIGQIDLPLNDEGMNQAKLLAQRLESFKINNVFCSDLSRSRTTASEIASSHNLTPEIIPELREISLGDWEGLPFPTVIKKYPDEFRKRGNDIVNFRPPGGESFVDCRERVLAAFDKIIKSSTGNIILAGHAGVNRVLLCHMLGMPLENLFNISQDYACLNIIFIGNSRYRLTLMNETR